ncbi:unnamed protein product [Boreogadus saida]
MTMLLDGITQRIEFCSSGDDGSSSDEVFDYCLSRNSSYQSPGSACRTPRVNRQRSRSIAQSFSPIPYTALKNLRLFDSPSTPKWRFKYHSMYLFVMVTPHEATPRIPRSSATKERNVCT